MCETKGTIMRFVLAGIAFAGLGACLTQDLSQAWAEVSSINLLTETRRGYEESYLDIPFEAGAVVAIAEEHGDLHTYSLTPCGEGKICGLNGRAGDLQRTRDHFVVTGAYPERTFYLSPGGDGFLNWRGENRDLAWN